ncbi:MAG: cytochrome c [Myxococcota bacterium]
MGIRLWIVAAGALLIGCGDDADGENRVPDILALTGDVTSGAALYITNCANCHGRNGEGGIGPEMTAAVQPLDDETLVDSVLYGIGTMPDHEYLSDQEMADILAYVRDAFGQ